ncbi:MAG: NAD-dependent deacylase [Anaerolineales bacterium]|nr:NAD-dependent deacylase [Anaerolineales bacterium]
MNQIEKAVEVIQKSKYVVAFTGAGISVESGIPSFRGENGLWSRYDPQILDIDFFYRNPEKAWNAIHEIFYDHFGKAKPNAAHRSLVALEKEGYLQALITQNIDNLHQEAGSQRVIEYHGNSQRLICTNCDRVYPVSNELITQLVPICINCGQPLKPDFVFFGEAIPRKAIHKADEAVKRGDLWLVIGTTGEVMPACVLPREAYCRGARIIEVNTHSSAYTNTITDIYLQGKAAEILPEILELLGVEI